MNDKRACAGHRRVGISATYSEYISLSIYISRHGDGAHIHRYAFHNDVPGKRSGVEVLTQAARTSSWGVRKIFIYITQTSSAEAYVGPRHRESRGGSPRRRGTGPRTHRATTKDPPPMIMGGGGAGNTAGRERARSNTFDTYSGVFI